MRVSAFFTLALLADAAWACEGVPICQVDPDTLALTQIIDFEGLQAAMGPGHLVDDVLSLPGARFAERFAGQALAATGAFDTVQGSGSAPLTLLPGAPGETMSLVWISGTTLLTGFGPAGFPRRDGQGEGAVAVAFDTPQPALSFEIRGGEGGAAQVQFLRQDGSEITTLQLTGLGEGPLGFLRAEGVADIAGIVVTNKDAQGIALDNIRFGPPAQIS